MKKLIKKILAEYDSDKEIIHGPRHGSVDNDPETWDIQWEVDPIESINTEVKDDINYYLTTFFSKKFDTYELEVLMDDSIPGFFVYKVAMYSHHNEDEVSVYFQYNAKFRTISTNINYTLTGVELISEFDREYNTAEYRQALDDIAEDLKHISNQYEEDN